MEKKKLSRLWILDLLRHLAREAEARQTSDIEEDDDEARLRLSMVRLEIVFSKEYAAIWPSVVNHLGFMKTCVKMCHNSTPGIWRCCILKQYPGDLKLVDGRKLVFDLDRSSADSAKRIQRVCHSFGTLREEIDAKRNI